MRLCMLRLLSCVRNAADLVCLLDSVNMGRGRDVPTPMLPETFNVHRSVDIRMQATDFVQTRTGGTAPYIPRARYKATPHWID